MMESGKTPVIQQLSYLMEHYNTASFSLGEKNKLFIHIIWHPEHFY